MSYCSTFKKIEQPKSDLSLSGYILTTFWHKSLLCYFSLFGKFVTILRIFHFSGHCSDSVTLKSMHSWYKYSNLLESAFSYKNHSKINTRIKQCLIISLKTMFQFLKILSTSLHITIHCCQVTFLLSLFVRSPGTNCSGSFPYLHSTLYVSPFFNINVYVLTFSPLCLVYKPNFLSAGRSP